MAAELLLQSEEFSRRVLDWFDRAGRKHLPWQQQPTLYRVWVSEIMLQQTQVTTVIPYYERFLARFPDVETLAAADLDEVLQRWAGLGYYARARHLHQTARLIRDRHDGQFPLKFATVSALPGVGRSTAGAILALATGQRQPILDGNVKRVLARYHGIAGWPGQTAVAARLWELADHYTPVARVADYTQAMMDLGALLCTRHRPQCQACPLVDGCQAHAEGRETAYPGPRPARSLPIRTTRLLLLRLNQCEVLLEKRPPVGLWGGLWSFPECPPDVAVVDWCREQWGLALDAVQTWDVRRHSFSHFHLDITPLRAEVRQAVPRVMEGGRFLWYNVRQGEALALTVPVRRLLTILANDF